MNIIILASMRSGSRWLRAITQSMVDCCIHYSHFMTPRIYRMITSGDSDHVFSTTRQDIDAVMDSFASADRFAGMDMEKLRHQAVRSLRESLSVAATFRTTYDEICRQPAKVIQSISGELGVAVDAESMAAQFSRNNIERWYRRGHIKHG